MVEESWGNGHINPPLNINFLALIPKKDNSVNLDDFRLISLYNFTYKLIAKVISQCLNKARSSPFFLSERGLRQGFPIYSLLFLLVVEGMSRAILDAKRRGLYEGIKIATNLSTTQLLFVDDILLFCNDSTREAEKLLAIW